MCLLECIGRSAFPRGYQKSQLSAVLSAHHSCAAPIPPGLLKADIHHSQQYVGMLDNDKTELSNNAQSARTNKSISPDTFEFAKISLQDLNGKESDHIPFELSEDGQDHRRIDLDAVQ